MVWTKSEFITGTELDWSESWWPSSKRDGTIKEIDDGLDAYHAGKGNPDHGRPQLLALDRVLLKFEREISAAYAKDSSLLNKKRKNAVAKLRLQVESILWQWDYEDKAKERSDLQAFVAKAYKGTEDVDDLAGMLEKLKIEVKQGRDATNKLKRDLHAALEDYFGPAGKKYWIKPIRDGVVPWIGYFLAEDEPSDTIRIATVDMDSVLAGGQVDYLRFGRGADNSWMNKFEEVAMFGKTKIGTDATVGPNQSLNQVAQYLPGATRKLMEDYLRTLLLDDLVGQSEVIDRALKSEPGYRAVVHIDYYATRSTTQVGLHKDTNGNNVFAVLHYINDEPMLGPEYIDDPAPIRSRENGYYPSETWAKLAALPKGDKYYRQGAPWAKVGESVSEDGETVTSAYTWPRPLLQALQKARVPLKDITKYKMSYETLPKDGLVTFVDELIFHATPITAHRTDSQAELAVRYLSGGAQVISLIDDKGLAPGFVNLFGTRAHADRVKRRLSAHYSAGVHVESGIGLPGSTSGGVRKFFRLWICIVPDHWYSKLPAYKEPVAQDVT